MSCQPSQPPPPSSSLFSDNSFDQALALADFPEEYVSQPQTQASGAAGGAIQGYHVAYENGEKTGDGTVEGTEAGPSQSWAGGEARMRDGFKGNNAREAAASQRRSPSPPLSSSPSGSPTPVKGKRKRSVSPLQYSSTKNKNSLPYTGEETPTKRVRIASPAKAELEEEEPLNAVTAEDEKQARAIGNGGGFEEPDSDQNGGSSDEHEDGRGDFSYTQNDAYKASKFGGIREYLKNKRTKLQIQNREIASTQGTNKPQIFRSLEIYINGYTVPPLEKLRTMIMQHGGTYIPYLDRKGMITHIIATNLTPAKFKEFVNYKVVKPEWIVRSVEEGRLLDWREWKLTPRGGEVDVMRRGMMGFLSGPGTTPRGTGNSASTLQKGNANSVVSSVPKAAGSSSAQASSSKLVIDSSVIDFEDEESAEEVEKQEEAEEEELPESMERAPPAGQQKIREDQDMESWESSPVRQVELPDADMAGGVEAVAAAGIPLNEAPAPAAATQSPPPPSNGQAEAEAPHPRRSPPRTTDPLTFRQSAWNGYAKYAENQEAKRLMKSEEWREANTAVNDKFLEGYYQNSRLHHLSTWKSELKLLMAEAQKRVESSEAVEKLAPRATQHNFSLAGALLPRLAARGDMAGSSTKKTEEQVIMHVDFDAFFVSCGLASRPELKGKPIVVCHAKGGAGEASTSEIASCSYEARAFGVKNGMSLGKARTLCPEVRSIPYEFAAYREKSLAFYTILLSYADELQAVSIDEALINVSMAVAELGRAPPQFGEGGDADGDEQDSAKQLAENIRADVREATGCEISIGIGTNILLARLATRRAKPAGAFHLKPDVISECIAPLTISELPGFAYAAEEKIEKQFGTCNCGELLKIAKGPLQACLGKVNGQTLYNFIRGIDVRKITPNQERRSVSAEVNYGIRFINEEEALKFLAELSAEVGRRLKAIDRLGRSVTLKVMVRDPEAPIEAPKFMGHGVCNVHNRSMPIASITGGPTDDGDRIGAAILKLYQEQRFDPKELRGIGIQVQKLEPGKGSAEERAPGQQMLSFAKQPAVPVDTTVLPPPKSAAPKLKAVAPPAPVSASPIVILDSSPTVVAPPVKRKAYKAAQPVKPGDIDPAIWDEMDAAIQDEYRGAWRLQGIAIPPHFRQSKVTRASMSPAKARDRRGASLAPSETGDGLDPKIFAGISAEDLDRLGFTREQFAALPKDTRKSAIANLKVQKQLFKKAPDLRISQSPSGPQNQREITVDRPKRPEIKMGSSKIQGEDIGSVMDGITTWMDTASGRNPHPSELKVLKKYLRRCLDPASGGIGGVQDAVRVLSWWRKVCRGKWQTKEHKDDAEKARENAWKAAFVEVKRDTDELAIKRFGGPIALD